MSRGGEAPDPDALAVSGVLLASEDGRFPPAAIDFAGRLAKRSGAPVHVLAIARVWGTSLGFPAPGLFPSRAEVQRQRDRVGAAIERLERSGLEVEGEVIGTRAGAKRIIAAARRRGCDAIVMCARDEARNRFVASFMWSQEPYRVRRRAEMPVYVVVGDGEAR